MVNGLYIIKAIANGYALYNASITVSGNTVHNIQLQQAVVLKGHAVDGNGQPLSNILVTVISNTSGWMSFTVTDADGYYEFISGFKLGDDVTIFYSDMELAFSVGMYVCE